MELTNSLWKAHGSEKAKIVLLHGMGGTGALWRPVAAALESDFTCLAPDQRGHGGSRIAEPHYAPLDYGRDVVETMATLRFHPAFLVGHSMGVRTACAAAHLKPSFTRGVVLVDLGLSGVAGGGLGDGLARFLKILPMHFASREDARAFMNANCPDPAIAQYLMAVSLPARDQGITFPFDQAALIQTIDAARDFSARTWVRDLASKGMRFLILRGAKSLVWSHEDFAAERELFRDLPAVEFREIEGAGHGLPFEKRAEFVAALKNFIAAT